MDDATYEKFKNVISCLKDIFSTEYFSIEEVPQKFVVIYNKNETIAKYLYSAYFDEGPLIQIGCTKNKCLYMMIRLGIKNEKKHYDIKNHILGRLINGNKYGFVFKIPDEDEIWSNDYKNENIEKMRQGVICYKKYETLDVKIENDLKQLRDIYCQYVKEGYGEEYGECILDSIRENEELQMSVEDKIKKNPCILSKNLILFGPPGTGKTYMALDYAVALCNDDKEMYENIKQGNGYKHNENITKYQNLLNEKRIAFVTFHQSYSYEDFVEGIFPVLKEQGQAAQYANEQDNNVENDKGISNVINYTIKDGIFKEICKSAKNDPFSNYVIIIDEINRADISKVFGELLTLIEPSKRLGMNEQLSVTLPYSREEFSVPQNVHIIGTMNTADRSIAIMDMALRRRFEFFEVRPNAKLLEGIKIKDNKDENLNISVSDMLEAMNVRISALLDKEHQIGHSYFMPLIKDNNEPADIAELDEIFRNKVIPLLQEYFYDDYEKIKLVLNSKKDVISFIRIKTSDVKDYFPYDYNELVTIYDLNDEAFGHAESYINIYDGIKKQTGKSSDETADR